jgi:hypothetical protein
MDSDPVSRQGQMRQKRPTIIDDDTPFKDDEDDLLEDNGLAARLFNSGRATTNLADLRQEDFFERLEQRNPQDRMQSSKFDEPTISSKCK